MADWSGWGWGWSWDWRGWGWGGSGQDWTGGSRTYAGRRQRGNALAGSAGDDATINPQALRQDQERRNLGLTGAWVEWDVNEFRRLVAALPEAGSDAKESLGLVRQSKRHTQLGKAFQNYRRHTLDKLKKTQEMARLFKIWSAVSADRPLSLPDLLWNDSNMHAFVTQHVNYESIMRWRRAQAQRVLARALPPSLLDLWRFALVTQHTAWQNKYMPDVDPNRFVRQPPPLWVENKGGAYEPTEIERRLWSAASAGMPHVFYMATEMEKRLSEAVTTTNPALEERTLVEKLEALSGSGRAILND